MATNHDVWDAVAQTDGTPGNSFEFLLRIRPGSGGAFIQSADVTNVNPAFTAKNRSRETYAAKGRSRASKYGEDLVLTFDVEVIRDENGQYQAFLQDLLNASRTTGAANRRLIQAFDALGADYAFQSEFSIQASRSGTGADEAAFFTVTATQYGETEWIANPVLVGNVPTIADVSPDSAAAGATVYVQGAYFDGVANVTGVKFGSTNATSYTVISDTLISAVVPAGSAGEFPVTVTHPQNGSSEPVPFTRIA